MRLELPYPVSANRYWRTTKGRVYVSKEAEAYKAQAAWIARAAGMKPATGPVSLGVTLIPKNGITMDLDNALKVTLDALKGIAYVDDKQVVKIVAERVKPDGIGGLAIELNTFLTVPTTQEHG